MYNLASGADVEDSHATLSVGGILYSLLISKMYSVIVETHRVRGEDKNPPLLADKGR
jgi:hypothetical protein